MRAVFIHDEIEPGTPRTAWRNVAGGWLSIEPVGIIPPLDGDLQMSDEDLCKATALAARPTGPERPQAGRGLEWARYARAQYRESVRKC